MRPLQLLLLLPTCLLPLSFAFVTRKPPSHGHYLLLFAQKEATFGMGCFWKPSEELLKVDGVIDTIVGYTGNPEASETEAPTYEKVCYSRKWVEAVRVLYDDEYLSYEQLLDAFFEAQEPKFGSRQYGSYIFPHDKQQQEIAKQWLLKENERVRERDGVTMQFTTIEPLTPFFQAENYHQRYWQKTRPRVAALIALLAISSGAVDSITPVTVHSTLHSVANDIALAGLLYLLFERKIDTKVVRL